MDSLRFLARKGFGFYEVFPSVWSVFGTTGTSADRDESCCAVTASPGVSLPGSDEGVSLVFQGTVTDLLEWLEESSVACGAELNALRACLLEGCSCHSPQRDRFACPRGGTCAPITGDKVCRHWENCRVHLGRGFCRFRP